MKLTDEQIRKAWFDATHASMLPSAMMYDFARAVAMLAHPDHSGDGGAPADCSGTPENCPDNEGFGCHCGARNSDVAAPAPQDGEAAVPASTANQPPFANCRFKICDLPGQCSGEGHCHHPKTGERGAAPQDGDERECLSDVVSHFDNLRAGLCAQRLAASDANDTDSVAYWNHEISVLERMKAQAQAALASNKAAAVAAKRQHGVTLTGAQLLEALNFIAPNRVADADQLEGEVTLQRGDGHSGRGLYCWLSEYPEEGATLLSGEISPVPIASASEAGPVDSLALRNMALEEAAKRVENQFGLGTVADDIRMMKLSSASGEDLKIYRTIADNYATHPAAAQPSRAEVLGWKLAMRVLQSDLYATLDDAERAECDALVEANPHIGGKQHAKD